MNTCRFKYADHAFGQPMHENWLLKIYEPKLSPKLMVFRFYWRITVAMCDSLLLLPIVFINWCRLLELTFFCQSVSQDIKKLFNLYDASVPTRLTVFVLNFSYFPSKTNTFTARTCANTVSSLLWMLLLRSFTCIYQENSWLCKKLL